MTRLDRLRERFPVSPRLHAAAAWFALVFFSLIVSSGAAVRLTGSGLGCSEWPRCNSVSVTPTTGHGFIEFGNRLVTTPVSIAAVACLLFALLRRPYRRDFTVLGALLVVGVLAQAILGGITVLTELNATIVMGHFLLSMVTIVFCGTLVWRVMRERRGRPERPEHDAVAVWLVRALVVLGAVVVLVGSMTTAAGPYAGGSGTGDEVARLTIFGGDTFLDLIALHSRIALAFGIAAVVLWLYVWRRGLRELRVPLTAVCVMVALAGLVGTLQYHVLSYPAGLVWVHITVVTVLWGTLVWALLAAGRPVRAAVPETPPATAPRGTAAA